MRGLSATVALAACLFAGGCGAKSADDGAIDAPGILVFSGLPTGPFLHSMRPDGSELRGVALPETCSPESFSRDGRTLVCFNLDHDPFDYAVQREGTEWRRVSTPVELPFPNWADPAVGDVDASQWAPARNRIAFIRPTGDGDYSYWFSATGDVAVADPDGSNERVVAADGEAPAWSPDAKRLAFARCRVFEGESLKEWFGERTADCSLWTVEVAGKNPPKLLVENAASAPIWSPDGRFVAFLRHTGACTTFCRSRILVVPASGGDVQEIGPELVQLNDCPSDWCPDIAWLPESAPVLVAAKDESGADQLELQRCVDIWNRARITPFPPAALNVSLVEGRCQITLSDYGGVCSQSKEMPFRYWCPSHGLGLHQLPPEFRVWNGHGAEDGTISLFDPPKGRRLPLPKAPLHPMLGGYVIPYGKDGEPLADLKLTEVVGTCYGTGEPDGYPLPYPDRYPAQCWWNGSGSRHCFKHPGQLAIGDTVLCPEDPGWDEPYDPMHYFRVKVTRFE